MFVHLCSLSADITSWHHTIPDLQFQMVALILIHTLTFHFPIIPCSLFHHNSRIRLWLNLQGPGVRGTGFGVWWRGGASFIVVTFVVRLQVTTAACQTQWMWSYCHNAGCDARASPSTGSRQAVAHSSLTQFGWHWWLKHGSRQD
jgi:hypothetical protein